MAWWPFRRRPAGRHRRGDGPSVATDILPGATTGAPRAAPPPPPPPPLVAPESALPTPTPTEVVLGYEDGSTYAVPMAAQRDFHGAVRVLMGSGAPSRATSGPPP